MDFLEIFPREGFMHAYIRYLVRVQFKKTLHGLYVECPRYETTEFEIFAMTGHAG